MPVIPGGGGGSTGNVADQVAQTSQAATTQLNWRQLVGELQQWNPDLPSTIAERFINNCYRKVIDYRTWYGLTVKGQVKVPNVYSLGTVAVTTGSATIVGTGTNWDATMVGRQFRVGFTSPIYTITAVADATHLTIEMPWGNQALASTGYSIFQQIVSLGANIKHIISMLNQQQGYRLATNIPKAALDTYDTWRTQTGWTKIAASWGPSITGEPQWELYPIPTSLQAFPYLAYVQPPDLSDDNPFPYACIRADIIVMGAIPDALLFRGPQSKYYDPNTARLKMATFAQELEKASRMDDSLGLQNLLWQFEQYPLNTHDAAWAQAHDVGGNW